MAPSSQRVEPPANPGRFILLTGAGFSRNWGGWLTNEAFEYLLGRPELNPRIRNSLWKNNGNFETTFQDLLAATSNRADASASDDFQRFNSMLLNMFEAMTVGFRSSHMETSQASSMIRTDCFLSHFDAIFTLNQDTYLEQHYVYQPVHETTHGHWAGIDIPGLQTPSPAVEHGNQLSKAGTRQVLRDGFALIEGWQPYIKLHGSYNWRTENGHLLITGGAKNIEIAKVPLLTWYHEQFRATITKANVKLMIIGYSFGDAHINQQLEAAARSGTKMFIVDPHGVDVIHKRSGRFQSTQVFDPLFTNLRDSIVGASRRPLRGTLHNDPVELKKFVDFLGLKIKWVYDTDSPSASS